MAVIPSFTQSEHSLNQRHPCCSLLRCCTFCTILSQDACTIPFAMPVSLSYPFNKQTPNFRAAMNFHRACTERTAHSAFSAFTLLLFWLLQVIAVINLGKLALVMDSRRGLGVKQWWAMETVVSKESSCNPLTGVDKMGGRKRPNVWRPSDGSILGEGWRERRGNPAERQLRQHMWVCCLTTVEEAARAQQENKRAGDELLVQWHC